MGDPFESDKARLRPPPTSFLTRKIGGYSGSSTTAPTTSSSASASTHTSSPVPAPYSRGSAATGTTAAAPPVLSSPSQVRSAPVSRSALAGRYELSSGSPVTGSPGSAREGGTGGAPAPPSSSSALRFGSRKPPTLTSDGTPRDEDPSVGLRSHPVSLTYGTGRASSAPRGATPVAAPQPAAAAAAAPVAASPAQSSRHEAAEDTSWRDDRHDPLDSSTGRADPHESARAARAPPARGVSTKRKAGGTGAPPARTPATAHRAKSPGPQAAARSRTAAGGAKKGAGPVRRQPSELEMAKVENERLRATVESQRAEVADMEDRAEEMQRSFEEELQRKHNEAQEAIDLMGAEMQELAAQKDAEIRRLGEKVEATLQEVEHERRRVEEQKRTTERVRAEGETRIQTITSEANQRIDEYEDVIQKFQEEVERLEGIVRDRDETIAQTIAARDNRYSEYEEMLMIGEKTRAELHNSLVEIKGNIRVFARVRPVLAAESKAKFGDSSTHFEFPEGTDHRTLHVVDVPGHQSVMGGKSENNKLLPFTFDKVYSPQVSQEQCFEDISQLIQSALDGYKVCVFAYGQTGSGKTYTMEGPSPGVEDASTGMIARAVNQIFDNCQWKSKRTGFRFEIVCSFLEIYNEQIFDLLDPKGLTQHGTSAVKHDIRVADGEAQVSNIHEEIVRDKHHVYELLQIANENRSTAGTKMNERASRSHSVFMMKIHGYNEATRQRISGLLNLVDLAGSERLSKSGAEGERLRETQHINKSLACLGDVIAALAKGDSAHVPFRQSKLTHLLQPSMTNESKTLMFVNINPVRDHLHESLCSLRFASKVNACEIGIAKRKVKHDK